MENLNILQMATKAHDEGPVMNDAFKTVRRGTLVCHLTSKLDALVTAKPGRPLLI